MRAKQCMCFNINSIAGEGLVPVKCMFAPTPSSGLVCCPFYVGSSVVVDSFFIVAPILCRGSVVGPCFVM